MKDKAYYEDVNIKNELKLRDMIQKLPKFCMDFFIGIVCTIFEKDSYFLELNIIFLIVVITMLIGKLSLIHI